MTSLTSTPFHTLIPAASERPGDDPIFKLNAEAKARAARGESIVNATLGALMEDDGSLAVMPVVSQAFAQVPVTRAASYAPIAGDAEYLSAVIHDLFGDGPLKDACVAAATPGGTGALHHAIINFLEPGHSLLVPKFFWGPYRTLTDHTRRGLETYEMFDERGRFNVRAFERALDKQIERQGRAMPIFNFPCNNPTGYSLDSDEWEAITTIVEARASRAPVIVLFDLAYAKFGAEGSGAWVRYAERLARTTTVLCAWTVSKSFAQYGARVGALVAATHSEDERQRIKNALSYSCRGTWSNCNHAGLLAITELLTHSELAVQVDAERARLCELIDERVVVFNEKARGTRLRYPRYEGGFFVTVFTDRAQDVAAHMREHAGVYVVPIAGAVRVALCSTPKADVPRMVSALDEALAAFPG